MTDPSPYQPAPLDIPAGHPLLDTGPIVDFRALGEVGPSGDDLRSLATAGPSGDQLAAALETLAKAGVTMTDIDSIPAQLSPGSFRLPPGITLPPGLAEKLNAVSPPPRGPRDARHRCHRCNVPVDRHHQWMRRATDDEAEAWHTAREQHIRAHNDGRAAAEYVSDRSDTVTLAVHGCDEHNLAPEPDEPVDSSPEALGAVNFAAQDAGAALRALLHDADCGGHGACQCGDGDA